MKLRHLDMYLDNHTKHLLAAYKRKQESQIFDKKDIRDCYFEDVRLS
jgi:hypothetical protein